MGQPDAIVDGRPAQQGALARLRRRGQRLMVLRTERDEAELERRLLDHPGVTRANLIAVMSPTGGVGKSTCTFVLANLLATHLKLRVIAVDANPEFGTLAQLAPDGRRPAKGLAELLDDADRIHAVAELGPYLTRLPTGLHLLAAKHDPGDAARLGPHRYGELVAMLACFYEVVVLDFGPGMVSPLATFAARRPDCARHDTRPRRLGHHPGRRRAPASARPDHRRCQPGEQRRDLAPRGDRHSPRRASRRHAREPHVHTRPPRAAHTPGDQVLGPRRCEATRVAVRVP